MINISESNLTKRETTKKNKAFVWTGTYTYTSPILLVEILGSEGKQFPQPNLLLNQFFPVRGGIKLGNKPINFGNNLIFFSDLGAYKLSIQGDSQIYPVEINVYEYTGEFNSAGGGMVTFPVEIFNSIDDSLASIDGKVATSSKQDTGNTSLASIDGKVATSSKQDTGNTSLASIDGKVATSARQTDILNAINAIESNWLPYKLIAAASTNTAVVKNSAGKLGQIVAIGLTANVRYLKFFDKATIPTLGTDTPVYTYPIPANTQGAGLAINLGKGINFNNGIAIAIVAGIADSNNTAISANDCVINLGYA